MERFIEERKRNPSKQAVFLDVLLANKELPAGLAASRPRDHLRAALHSRVFPWEITQHRRAT
jgi:hypothetical protein